MRLITALSTVVVLGGIGLAAPAQAAPTSPGGQIIKVRVDRQQDVVAVPVTGVSSKDRIFVNWGDQTATQRAPKVRCAPKRAAAAPDRCSLLLRHEYDEPGTYQVTVNSGSKQLTTAQVIVFPIARPWSPPEGWQQPAGWAVLNGGATYLPCATVPWFWDATGQPADRGLMRETARQALDRISVATGLTFVETADPAQAKLTFDWKFDPDRYAGAAGYAGGSRYSGTGHVTLNPNNWWTADEWAGFGAITRPYVSPEGWSGSQSADGNGDLILHEVGHALGLAHVDDPVQTMHPGSSTRRDGYGPGDLNGLWQMYQSQPCPAPESL